MKIQFECKTNKPYVMVNTLKVRLASGSELTIDRTDTDYSIANGVLHMVWDGCYLWAIDGFTLFYGDPNIFEEDEFWGLVEKAEVEFELEDDADEDYVCDIVLMKPY